jgi:hypothetical protein
MGCNMFGGYPGLGMPGNRGKRVRGRSMKRNHRDSLERLGSLLLHQRIAPRIGERVLALAWTGPEQPPKLLRKRDHLLLNEIARCL